MCSWGWGFPVMFACTMYRRLCGSLGCYDISKEKRVSLKTPIQLQTYNRIFHKVTTTDDPIIRRVGVHTCTPPHTHMPTHTHAHTHIHTHIHTQLVKSPECSDVKVFATDAILATLMTCSRSKYSWDIVATRIGQHLFFDKRDESQFGKRTHSLSSLELSRFSTKLFKTCSKCG